MGNISTYNPTRMENIPAGGAVPDNGRSEGTAGAVPVRTLEKLRDGDHESFEEVFHHFYPRVKAFLRAITKSEDMADEVAQKVFVNLWMYRSSINPGKNFNAYVYTAARNAAFTALKSQDNFDAGVFDISGETGGSEADEIIIARETALLIKMTVSRMPAKRKLVYEMSRYECKTNDEISRELNISRKVVEKHLRLALNEIREVVGMMALLFFN